VEKGRYKQESNLLFSIIPSFQPSIIALNNYMPLQMNTLLHFLYRTHVITRYLQITFTTRYSFSNLTHNLLYNYYTWCIGDHITASFLWLWNSGFLWILSG